MDEHRQITTKLQIFVWLCGILLPCGAVLFELVTSACSSRFFDPIPGFLYVILFLAIPLFNGIVLETLRKGRPGRLQLLFMGNGFSVGMALMYTIMFLPILPMGLICIAFLGIGLCAFAPLASLVSALVLTRLLRGMTWEDTYNGTKYFRIGLLLSLCSFAAINLHITATRIGMCYAHPAPGSTDSRVIEYLRAYGHRDTMLRGCYESFGPSKDFIGLILILGKKNLSPEDAQKLFYRVTGASFSSFPQPGHLRDFMGGPDLEPSPESEENSLFVGRKTKNLALSESSIDGSIDPDASLAYLEWTMVFHNSSSWGDSEARARLTLPPGGVVSRATLWIEGEENEAAFASRRESVKAYNDVVRARRDPLLVTTDGGDMVLIKCSPVPAGGSMKIRIGITCPLELKDRSLALLRLPGFYEQNFSVTDKPLHKVWIESRLPIRAVQSTLRNENPKRELYSVRGALTPVELSSIEAVIKTEREPGILCSWSVDPKDGKHGIIVQSIEKDKSAPPEAVTIIIDGSACMKSYADEIAAALKGLPEGIELRVLLASDSPVEIFRVQKSSKDTPSALGSLLKHARFVGGQDNIAALVNAWEDGACREHHAILWIHGPQPVILSSPEELVQRLRRRPSALRIVSIQVSEGPDPVMEKLSGRKEIVRLQRSMALGVELEDAVKQIAGKGEWLILAREKVVKKPRDLPRGAQETSAHLARLWAYDRISSLLYQEENQHRREAVELATRYQLVTPVSGAVVLESAKQYQNAGLQQVEPDEVPTIPEPETRILIIIAIMFTAICIILRKSG